MLAEISENTGFPETSKYEGFAFASLLPFLTPLIENFAGNFGKTPGISEQELIRAKMAQQEADAKRRNNQIIIMAVAAVLLIGAVVYFKKK